MSTMQTRARDRFVTITTEGPLLPADVLGRIMDGALDGVDTTDYHLDPGERLGERITRDWQRLLGAWHSLRDALTELPDGQPATSPTRERWLLPLFDALGYGRLQTGPAHQIAGRTYPVSHGWGPCPIHLVGWNVPIDRRTPGVAGAAGQSPHGLVQELLNASDVHLWGFVSNGRLLRVLRDNASLTRQAYVEFDLEAMMDAEAYSDFAVLWLVCHQSRVEAERPELCWLESWTRTAAEEGTRALEGLRKGVEAAITSLGQGVLADRANTDVRDRLRTGALTGDDLYRELLRLVYRLLFLFVAEDRDLLHPPDTTPEARAVYARYYGTRRLRRLAERRRGGPHTDAHQALTLVMDALGRPEGCPELGLPALGSFLWSREALPNLAGASIANEHLLAAIRALSSVTEKGTTRAVDYRNLGAEELGSVYESLLELHPQINADAATFALTTAAGNERKTTGSYYTPSSLIEVLLDVALDPVLAEAVRAPDAEQAILNLAIVDPACGSGHFLVAAAHRIAKRLASVRTGDEEPAPAEVRHAIRDVVGHCIYGVDMNPMAVELCKVALWMETIDPGRPLSFLDSHIRCGNSLLGTTPMLVAGGVPDDAFTTITGDDKQVVKALKARNRAEAGGQTALETAAPDLDALARAAVAIDGESDHTLGDIERKQERYRGLVDSTDFACAKGAADTWCAAFVAPKVTGAAAITADAMVRAAAGTLDGFTRSAVDEVADAHGFFHWHLEFPQIHARGGFDCVLGNPPWEKVEFKEKEFFAGKRDDIAAAAGASRKQLIAQLAAEDPDLDAALRFAKRQNEAETSLIRSGRYPLTGRGRINTYALFAELIRELTAPTGRAGCIVPTGIATDDTTKHFFGDLVESRSIASLYGFENEELIFPGVHHATKFCLLGMSGTERPCDEAEFVFFCRQTSALAEPDRRITLTPDDFALLNPNTRTCPIFRTRRDAAITKAIYRRVPVVIDESKGEVSNPWRLSFMQGLFNMTSDSTLFLTRGELEAERWTLDGNVFHRGGEQYLPLYEAKMVHHYDHRFGDYTQVAPGSTNTQLPNPPLRALQDPDYVPLPRYWVPEAEVSSRLDGRWDHGWLLGWRDIAPATNERTVIASVIPRVGVGHVEPLMLADRGPQDLAALNALLNSFALDFVARQKVGGTHLTYGFFKQFPVVEPSAFARRCGWGTEALSRWLVPRVLELTYTATDLAPFAQDLDYDGPPFRWDPQRRALLRAELDAAFFHLYLIGREDVDYILDTFSIVRRNDERAHGEFRTKRLVLERYDALAEAIATGVPYATSLDPPPADPRVAHRAIEITTPQAKIIPFPLRRVEALPEADRDRYVAIVTLKAAAGAFGNVQDVAPDGWAELPDGRKARPGMFIAEVHGRSMEPRIPNGAWCLFSSPVEGSRSGKIVLAQHHSIGDPDTGGSFTVKRYRSEKTSDDQLWSHTKIVLEPLNPAYSPIELDESAAGEVRIIAEVLDVF
jgi:phage repressor protein C with HTH and peptisase S24 domain